MELTETGITLMQSNSGVDMKTVQENILFTTPPGKTFFPFAVHIHGNSASLAGGTDYDFGVNSGATGWRQSVDLSGMTVTTGERWLFATDNTTYTPIPAGSSFVIKPSTGSTAACTATIDVFGFLK